MQTYYQTLQERAVQEVVKLLDQPGHSDLWELFPYLYGTYNSEFDICMIDVLTDINNGTVTRDDLASEIIKEILCTSNLCDYGTGPRTCFPTEDFKKILPLLIERWKSYYEVEWDERYSK